MLEIPENKRPEEKMASKLEALYSQVPGWENILVSVKEGREKFNADLQANGLEWFGLDTSKVHGYSDIETQAFILGIPSKENPEEISTKSYLTYGAHWIDDFFDNSNLGVQYEKLFDDRNDIKKVLNNLDKIGQAVFFMADKVPNTEGFIKVLGGFYMADWSSVLIPKNKERCLFESIKIWVLKILILMLLKRLNKFNRKCIG